MANICDQCWKVCDQNWNPLRAMLPNDDSKFNSHGPCNECAPIVRAQIALYRTVQANREIMLTKTLHNQIQMNAWKRPMAGATVRQ